MSDKELFERLDSLFYALKCNPPPYGTRYNDCFPYIDNAIESAEKLVAIANSFDEAMKYNIVSQGYVDNMRLGIKALKAWKGNK